MSNSRVSDKQSNLRSMHRLQSSSGLVKRQAMSPALVKLKTWMVEGLYLVGQLIYFFFLLADSASITRSGGGERAYNGIGQDYCILFLQPSFYQISFISLYIYYKTSNNSNYNAAQCSQMK